MPCIVCQHNQTKDIDRALLTGVSLTSLSPKYGFSTSALQRHKEHLMQKMAQAQTRFQDSLSQGLFCKLNIVLELVLHAVRAANAGGDFKLFLQAGREVTRIISLMHKMDVHLEPEMLYCLLASPQWNMTDSLLPNAFQALSDTRQTLAVNLFAPCPEPDPELIREPAQSSPVETQNSKLGTLNPTVALADPSPDLLQSVNPDLDQQPSLQTKAGNRKLETENRPLKKREKSAKLPKKMPGAIELNEGYQEDIVCEKISRPKRENLFQRLYRKWENTGKLAGKTNLNEGIN